MYWMLDVLIFNKENILMAFYAGVAFAIAYEGVEYVFKNINKK